MIRRSLPILLFAIFAAVYGCSDNAESPEASIEKVFAEKEKRIQAARDLIHQKQHNDLEAVAVKKICDDLSDHYRGAPEGFWKACEKDWNNGSFVDAAAEVYAFHLSIDDIESLSRFYATEAGRLVASGQVPLVKELQRFESDSSGPLADRWKSDPVFRDHAFSIYTEHLSEEGILGLLEFAESSSGKNVIKVQIPLLEDLRSAGELWATELEIDARTRLEKLGYRRK